MVRQLLNPTVLFLPQPARAARLICRTVVMLGPRQMMESMLIKYMESKGVCF